MQELEKIILEIQAIDSMYLDKDEVLKRLILIKRTLVKKN